MKLSVITILSLIWLSSSAQDVDIENVGINKLNDEKWTGWTLSTKTLSIEYTGQPGTYNLRLTGCNSEMVKFEEAGEDGTHYYKTALGMLGGTWCNKSYNLIATTRSLDDFLQGSDGVLFVFLDMENALAYSQDMQSLNTSSKDADLETEMITYYHENGRIKSEQLFLKRSLKDKTYVRHGISKWWYDNGQLEDVIEYKQNPNNLKKEIRWTVHESYHRDGRPRDGGTLKNGTGSFVSYDRDGNIESVRHFIDGVFQKNR